MFKKQKQKQKQKQKECVWILFSSNNGII